MKNTELTINDLEFILESLAYTKYNFENYQDYPSYEFKQKRLSEVDNVVIKIRSLKDALKEIE